MAPFHSGEIEVQARLGVTDRAARVGRSVHDGLPPAAARFLEQQPFVIVGGEAGGDVWASFLGARAGFAVSPDPRRVRVRAMLPEHDPLCPRLAAGGDLGMLWIDFLHRLRMRINGRVHPTPGGFEIEVAQAYSNCPQFITPRALAERALDVDASGQPAARESTRLDLRQRKWVAAADTFFIASRHPDGGADVSHRGGPPGFALVNDDGSLEWPDYQGNTMFNTLGNLVVDPRAGLLFVDFATGGTLQLAGRAEILWSDSGGAGRRVRFRVSRVVDTRRATALRWAAPDPTNEG